MSPAPPPALGDPWTCLALRAADPSVDRDQRTEALRELGPFLRDMARRVLRSLGRNDTQLQEELELFVSERLWERRCRPGWRCFAAWCWTVMLRRLYDLLQLHGPTAAPPESVPDPLADGAVEARDLDRALQEPFGPADLRRIRAWRNPRRRVVLLVRGSLWRKVPPAEWDTYLAQAGLTPPFPDEDFERLRPAGRIHQLAATFGLGEDAIRRMLSREGIGELSSLEFVRRMLADWDLDDWLDLRPE
jgi:hypothetical protein